MGRLRITSATFGCGLAILAALVVWFVVALRAAEQETPERVLLTTWVLEIEDTAEARERAITRTPQTIVRVPAHFDAELPAKPSTYTLHTWVDLPAPLLDRDLTLAIPYFTGRARLRVNGAEATPLEGDLVRGHRARGPQSFLVPRGVSKLSLDLEVEHTWTQSAWLDTAPRIVPLTRGGARDVQSLMVRAVNDVGSGIAFAALLQLGITYLAVYAAGQRRRAYVLFAIQVGTASVLDLHYLGFTQALVGTADVALLSVLISCATMVSIAFTHEQFELGPLPRWWRPAALFFLLVPVITSGPFTSTRFGAGSAVVSLVVVVTYQLVTLGKLTLRKDPPFGAPTMLASWMLLAAFSIVDGASWLGLGELLGGVKGACVGLALFTFMQSTLLGREHIMSLERSDDLNATLAQRVRELLARQRENRRLNDELRRQIADRSRQLFAALALLGTPNREAPSLAAGTVLQGRYRIVRPVGQGGMGTVYEVVRLDDDRRLALKVTRELDGTALARLAREAEVASHLSHPNVVGIVDVDVDPAGFLYLVLEYVDGPTLRKVTGSTDPSWALDVLRQIADGLDALHSAGIVHRDLKPSNVIVSGAADAPVVKITDFGVSRIVVAPASSRQLRVAESTASILAAAEAETVTRAPVAVAAAPRSVSNASVATASPSRSSSTGSSAASGSAASGSSSPLTEAGMLVGTPTYMAPELAFDPRQLSPAADMFSFGVMAYELLSGSAAFRAAPALERLEGRTVPPPPPIASVVPTLPRDVAELLDACLAFDATKRPTALTIARMLEVSATRLRAGVAGGPSGAGAAGGAADVADGTRSA